MQETNQVHYQRALPDDLLSGFIKCFWSVKNTAEAAQKFTILPDGHFDLLFRKTQQSVQVSLSGLWKKEMECLVPGNSTTFGVSFKLAASEYLFKESIAPLVDTEKTLPESFWGLQFSCLDDFSGLVKQLTQQMTQRLCKAIDKRKLHLFSTLYQADGNVTAEEVSNTILWSNRQISQYFKDQFGISLKTYCTILRYRASFEQLKDKQLYPEQNYTDQAHFIKEVRKFSGVTPGILAENENNRFIQLSTLRQE